MKSKPRVLQAGTLMPYLEEALAREFDTHRLKAEPDANAFLAKHGAEFIALATSYHAGANASLIEALPNLKMIANFGVGYDTVDVDCARRRGVVVSNTPDVLTDCVADLAMGLLIDVARCVSASERFLRRGDWSRAPFPLTTRVSGKCLGILGFGRIGRAIAKRARGFDMPVRYHSRRPVTDSEYAHEPSLVELARWSDFLMVACAGGAATTGLVSVDVLAALGQKGFLINISRGSVADEPALVDALLNQRIAGAALDVFADEPKVPKELLTLDNVVLAPHIGSATRETRVAMADLVLANLRSFFGEGRLLTPVP